MQNIQQKDWVSRKIAFTIKQYIKKFKLAVKF